MSGGVTGVQDLLLAETLGLAMARRAADILDRHRLALTSGGAPAGTGASAGAGAEADDAQFAADNAIFTAVLDAANECLGRFDTRPADDRWCDALLQVIHLGQLARFSSGGAASGSPMSLVAALAPGRQLAARWQERAIRRSQGLGKRARHGEDGVSRR